jgi:hypothetical protein
MLYEIVHTIYNNATVKEFWKLLKIQYKRPSIQFSGACVCLVLQILWLLIRYMTAEKHKQILPVYIYKEIYSDVKR